MTFFSTLTKASNNLLSLCLLTLSMSQYINVVRYIKFYQSLTIKKYSSSRLKYIGEILNFVLSTPMSSDLDKSKKQSSNSKIKHTKNGIWLYLQKNPNICPRYLPTQLFSQVRTTKCAI